MRPVSVELFNWRAPIGATPGRYVKLLDIEALIARIERETDDDSERLAAIKYALKDLGSCEIKP